MTLCRSDPISDVHVVIENVAHDKRNRLVVCCMNDITERNVQKSRTKVIDGRLGLEWPKTRSSFL